MSSQPFCPNHKFGRNRPIGRTHTSRVPRWPALHFQCHGRTQAIRRWRPTGFTLLELVLALGLTIVILAAITSAMQLYLLQLDRRRGEIEQKQVSRGVIRLVSEDLRSAIQYKAQDFSALENLVASQSLAGLGVGTGDENGELDQVDGSAGGSTTDQGSQQETAAEEPPGRPTLIGERAFVRVDTSRLPRLDEYNPLIAPRGAEHHLPSDIKSVTYFFSNSPPVGTDSIHRDIGQRGGLYRRQVDRAAEAYRSGDVQIVLQPDEYSELVAPEVASVQFRYWDGKNWRMTWDSQENNGFPTAIEIQIVIDSERNRQPSINDQVRDLELEVIRTVVSLPVAEICSDTASEEQP